MPDPALGPDPGLIEDLVAANHILADQGVVDAFGHVSARHDKRTDRFLLARNMAPGQVSAADIIEHELDGTPVDAAGRRVYLERFIHGGIYRLHPDVQAVVHSHSHAIVPLTTLEGFRFRPLCHMAGFIGDGAPMFEIRCVGGDSTDLLIRDNRLGEALAKCFDNGSRIVMMRGHGSTVVAPSVRLAVYRAVYAEMNARYLLDAVKVGEPTYLTPGEARSAMESTEGQVERPWNLWKARAAQRLAEV
ncbi:MAG TPA: class II aldolase/adducin family protein [Acetobacteraceae bacterium]|jgi:HCOMODA/2-hydroxy-3-carboxy-muconic semialdehyde decarboxylase|nr:class II aldolase/adducin family protein [Acetobacteraceae bacterium]